MFAARGGLLVGQVCAVLLLAADPPPAPREAPRAWASTGGAQRETDSLAIAAHAGGARVYATNKDGDVVDIFDAATGRFEGSWGRRGAGVGELRYPNGIVAASFPAAAREAVSAHAPRTAILVVERDNHRVQAFWADTRESAGVFGERELVAPYGAAVSHQGSAVVLYVTDPNAAPERRGQIFELRVRDAAIEAVRRGGFGERDGAGRMGDVESVVVDDALRRVYVCDEDARHVKVFELDGRFSGRTVGDGLVRGDPEGLVLCAAADGRYLVLTDQRKEQTVWHAFAADNLRHVGSWTGAPSTRNTDGVAILQQPLAGFPHGVFVAVNDDRDIHAYRVEDILHALRLQPAKDPP